MHLTLVGLSHKTAPVEIREKLTFPANRQENALSLLCCGDAVNEAVIVSTCNRTEVYAVTSEGVDGASAIIDFMCDYHDLDRHDLVPYLYLSEGEAVIRHLFRVVASLDSMVLGEAQILGQVKEAYEFSFVNGASQRTQRGMNRPSGKIKIKRAMQQLPSACSPIASQCRKELASLLIPIPPPPPGPGKAPPPVGAATGRSAATASRRAP